MLPERMKSGRLAAFRNDKINRFGAEVFDVRPRGIEVRVVWNHVAGLYMTENRMRSAARP